MSTGCGSCRGPQAGCYELHMCACVCSAAYSRFALLLICVFHVMVGMLTHLEQSKTSLLTVNTPGIVRVTVCHDLIVSISFMYHPGDYLRHTSADILSPEQCLMYSWQSCDVSCHTPQFIPINDQITSDWLIAHHGGVRNPRTYSYMQQDSSCI